MRKRHCKKLAALAFGFGLALVTPGVGNAQWNSPNAYGHSTGYGTVYGSYGLASTMQSMYNVARAQSQRSTERAALVKKHGNAAVEKAEREAASGSTSRADRSTASNPQIVVPPARVVQNHGIFSPDATVDTGKAMADAIADTPEDKALLKEIYTTTKAFYEKEAAAKGWKQNIAGGLTFFTAIAMTVYHDGGEPGADAVDTHYKILNATLDEIPDLASVSNKDKQGFNNLMIGFGGILLTGYSAGKQSNNAETLADYKKLAGILIEMVLKTDPENLRLENGRIVMK